MIYLGTSLVYRYLDSLNINDLPRPNSTLTRHLLDTNPANSNEYILLEVYTPETSLLV